jgi:hypothetical protein
MKVRLTLIALLSTFSGALAQDPAPVTPPANPPATSGRRPSLKYNVPKEVAAGERRDGDGGSRGDFQIPRLLTTLVPTSGKGLTTQAQPSLFTWQSEPARMGFVVTVTEPGKAQPLFVFGANGSATGFHRVDLAAYNITLAPNVDYEWSVAVRPDPKNRSADLFATGKIRRIEPDAALAEKIKNAAPADLAYVYAEAGIWYDALAAISDQLVANPKDKELVALRNGLLEQANLGKVTGKEKIPDRVKSATPKAGTARN